MRQISPWRAALAGLIGFGYLYVGRIRTALMLILSTLLLLAFAAWTRLLLHVEWVYVLVTMGLLIAAVQIIHPIVIAVRTRSLVAKPYNRWWMYLLWIIAASALCSLVVNTRGMLFGFETYRIPSIAMTPTLDNGDLIMVDAWRYGRSEAAVGDIVVFRHESGVNYVKRIVGLPNDRLEIRQGIVIRNGAPLVEPYLHEPLPDRPYGRDIGPLRLGDNEYYVLGDFRDNSQDSRSFGPIDSERIIGRVEFVWFSMSDWTIHWDRFPRDIVREP